MEVGYLLVDSAALLFFKFSKGAKLDMMLMLHHLVLASLLPLYLTIRKGDFYIACMFLMNSSTPFLHIRYFIGKSRWSGALPHSISTAVLLVVFLCARVLLWPVLFWERARHIGVSVWRVGDHVRWYCFASASVFAAMNIVWIRVLAAQAFAHEFRRGAGSRKEK